VFQIKKRNPDMFTINIFMVCSIYLLLRSVYELMSLQYNP